MTRSQKRCSCSVEDAVTVSKLCSWNEYTIMHEPSLACTKCNNSFQSEPYQYEKTNVFLQFLMSIKLKSAESEYKDIIRYVDKVLKFKGDED